MLSLLVSSAAFGQTVSGTVTDAETGEGLPGVNILVKNSAGKGTITDMNGNFAFSSLGNQDTLVVSYIGYASQEVPVAGKDEINVALQVDNKQLDEIVVIGFGTSTKKELTGSVSKLSNKDIKNLNPRRVEDALQGQIAGVQIAAQSGSPGGGQSIRIRGVSTNGDARPLIIVDGIQYGDDLNTIDPNIIKSVNVLKDATAAIYGVRAANGVIIIETKDGSGIGKPVLTIDSYYGVQETARKLPLLNATEYALLVNESFANGGQTPPFQNVNGLGAGTDWQDAVFEQAPIQNHAINYSGNTGKTNFAIGGAFFDQEGIVGGEKSRFKRFNGNLNLGTELTDKLDFKANFNYVFTERSSLLENTLGSVLFNAINNAPTDPVRNPDGSFTQAPGLGIEVINPIQQINNTFNETDVNRLSGVLGLDYEVIEDLTISSSFNYNYANLIGKSFTPEISYGTSKVFNTNISSVFEQTEENFFFNVDNIINYSREFGPNNVKFTLGNTIYQSVGEQLEVTAFSIPNNNPEFADISLADSLNNNSAGSFQFDTRQFSYFGRVQYDYNSRYFASALLRRDASSIFAPENQVGWFYAFSAGWIFSDESFFPGSDIFNFGKLRASYGSVGNDRVAAFAFLPLLNGEAEAVFDGGNIVQGFAQGRIPNRDLQWETNNQFNVGADLGFFDDIISITADYYIKDTRDLLIEVPVSGLTGVGAPGGLLPLANAGAVRNQGLELQLAYNQEVIQGLQVGVTYNFSTVNNEVLEVNNGNGFVQGGVFGIGQPQPTRFEEGFPIGYFLGLETNGIFQTAEEVATSAQPDANPGDLRYIDQNNDGVINTDDRVNIGDPIPDFIMGLNISISYKGFDFSTLVDAQIGNEIIRNYERNLPLVNRRRAFIQRWTGAGSTNDFPIFTTAANDNDLFSDFYVEDGSYARVKNIQLGYTLPTPVTERIGAGRVRFYFSVNNAFTFTNYSGFDPNVQVQGRDDASAAADPLFAGIDLGFYPVARTFIGGLNLEF